MGTISLSLPSDGDTIDASDVNNPLNTIAAVINGGIDADNIEAGGVVPNALTSGTGTSWAWTTFTPTWTGSSSNPAIGDGTLLGYYRQIGKTVHCTVILKAGSTTTYGSGTFRFAAPVAARNVSNLIWVGSCWLLDSGTINQTGVVFIGSSDIDAAFSASYFVLLNDGATGGFVGQTVPFTWAVNDKLIFTITYEAA